MGTRLGTLPLARFSWTCGRDPRSLSAALIAVTTSRNASSMLGHLVMGWPSSAYGRCQLKRGARRLDRVLTLSHASAPYSVRYQFAGFADNTELAIGSETAFSG